MGTEVRVQAQQKVNEPAALPHVAPGPIEGILIVNGRPQMERVDMPTISFEQIAHLGKKSK